MLNKYLIDNYDKLKDMAYNIAGKKGKMDRDWETYFNYRGYI